MGVRVILIWVPGLALRASIRLMGVSSIEVAAAAPTDDELLEMDFDLVMVTLPR